MTHFRLLVLICLIVPVWGNAEPLKGGNAHGILFKDIEGKPLPLSNFKGKAVLVVNTASRCGFTHQYKDLQTLWAEYRDKGLVVLGLPSNDFGGQEPGTEKQIKRFCELNYRVDFPMTSKISVKGPDAHPFYKWAEAQLGSISKPRWNFHKYLLNRDGKAVDWFATTTSPTATLAAPSPSTSTPSTASI